ncbi:LytTR family DNA-binding domain-containing protein [Dyadobacter sp. CY323]|uniref:LytR/AlgR family response regulator transcription factor n=1 Tax=Dyadobacter sp. CY323 TaxID=2907302 RepID=UPI001F34CDD0|nr:LytTR family DNA-binding domain-containing protein [Dyadobacter sp. CY323]MCE6991877.1 LytTR family DNA-binding domain-containing protein [Dyadobacter sp. CY323]
MIQCALIDDEPLAREILEGYLRQSGITRTVMQFGKAAEALVHLRNSDVDVLFLDIEMPEMNGIEFLKALSQPPVTVFTTAYRDYAFEGFELGVIDFLLKPISYERFLHALEKVQDFLALKDQNAKIEHNPAEQKLGSVLVKSGVQRILLDFNEVTHIQGLKDYAIIHTGKGKIVIKGSIKAMHEIFPESHFIRVHKSFIVALDKIKRIEKNQILINANHIPIGRNYKEGVLKGWQ